MITDVVVIGGGVVGLMSAFKLRQEGLDVVVVDQWGPARGASTAAGGVLAPLLGVTKPKALMDLAVDSMARWPAWLDELDPTGRFGIRRGVMIVAETPYHQTELKMLMPQARQTDPEAVEWTAAAVHQAAPGVASSIAGGLFYPEAGWVDPRRLYHTLYSACQLVGVRFRWGVPVLGLEMRANRVRGARVAGSVVPGGAVVLACGAWSGQLMAQMGRVLPVFPVKGTLVAVDGLPIPPFPLFGREHYLIPREDGSVLVGGTEERAGFGSDPSVAAIRKIVDAHHLYPSLDQARILGMWAGLRPATPDGLPFLGWWPEWEGLLIATGHFRNGILLGPITADIVTAILLGVDLPVNLAPFRPDRLRDSDWPEWWS